jgi:hypothetical protein
MADTLIFQVLDEDGERILDEFEQQTGLESEETDDGRLYPLGPDDHDIEVVGTLTDIDDAWTDHLALQDTAAREDGED